MTAQLKHLILTLAGILLMVNPLTRLHAQMRPATVGLSMEFPFRNGGALHATAPDPQTGNLLVGGWANYLSPADTQALLMMLDKKGKNIWEYYFNDGKTTGSLFALTLSDSAILVAGRRENQPWMACLNRRRELVWEHVIPTGKGAFFAVANHGDTVMAVGQMEGRPLAVAIVSGAKPVVVLRERHAGAFHAVARSANGHWWAAGQVRDQYALQPFGSDFRTQQVERLSLPALHGPANSAFYALLPAADGSLLAAGASGSEFVAASVDTDGSTRWEQGWAVSDSPFVFTGLVPSGDQYVARVRDGQNVTDYLLTAGGTVISIYKQPITPGTVNAFVPLNRTEWLECGWVSRAGKPAAMVRSGPLTAPIKGGLVGHWFGVADTNGIALRPDSRPGHLHLGPMTINDPFQLQLQGVPPGWQVLLLSLDEQGRLTVNHNHLPGKTLPAVWPAPDTGLTAEGAGAHQMVLLLSPVPVADLAGRLKALHGKSLFAPQALTAFLEAWAGAQPLAISPVPGNNRFRAYWQQPPVKGLFYLSFETTIE